MGETLSRGDVSDPQQYAQQQTADSKPPPTQRYQPDTAPAECSNTDTSCKDIEDLKAQRRMANAAEEQLALISRQNWIVGAEAGLLFLTLIASAIAAGMAGRAASAAFRTEETMRETAKRELRAYVFVSKREIDFMDAMEEGNVQVNGRIQAYAKPRPNPVKPRINLIIRNGGQTPAYDVRIYAHAVITSTNSPDLELMKIREDLSAVRSRDVLGPQGEREKQQIELTEAENVEFRDAYHAIMRPPYAVSVFVVGRIRYADPFSDNRFTDFRYFWNGDIKRRRDGRMAAHDGGNDADVDAPLEPPPKKPNPIVRAFKCIFSVPT